MGRWDAKPPRPKKNNPAAAGLFEISESRCRSATMVVAIHGRRTAIAGSVVATGSPAGTDVDHRSGRTHRTLYIDDARSRIYVHDLRRVTRDARRVTNHGNGPNFTITVSHRLRLIDYGSNDSTGRSANDGAFRPAIIVVSTDERACHSAKHRAGTNSRGTIDFRPHRAEADSCEG